MQKKPRKVEKKSKKKEECWERKWKKKVECTVDYCCNPCYVWVWGNSGFPTPFSYMYNVIYNNFWILKELGIIDEFYQIDKFWLELINFVNR
jgi:hypothetical protein